MFETTNQSLLPSLILTYPLFKLMVFLDDSFPFEIVPFFQWNMLIFGRVYDPDWSGYILIWRWGSLDVVHHYQQKTPSYYKSILSYFVQPHPILSYKKELIGITGWTYLTYCHPSMANCPPWHFSAKFELPSQQQSRHHWPSGTATKAWCNGDGMLMDFSHIIGVRNVEYVCSLLKRLTFLECCTKSYVFGTCVISDIKACLFLVENLEFSMNFQSNRNRILWTKKVDIRYPIRIEDYEVENNLLGGESPEEVGLPYTVYIKRYVYLSLLYISVALAAKIT